ncbi:MFS transporter [Streptomyces diastatochromogenes]|uniref:MFS transporter n=1 Tax=Streptomyces diastatochromogenes TaxID=42236 RepID=A0A233SHE6_STRDA|nr:MFS transporter [Streptomyces diastatochromogenes]MCZ0985542.1 MFS transporter [Streptomyces diastatochromogenes]OXY95065.1 MFS transporter [Streptomyces diastatochromogenes]
MSTDELIQPKATHVAHEPRRRGLMLLLLLANSSMLAVYMGVGAVLLPTQIAQIDPGDKVAILGIVGGVSSVFATAFNPIAGALSDRTGRRNPWILGGALASLAGLAFLGSVRTVLLVGIGWCLVQATMNVYQAAVTAVVPDRIPPARRGIASALVGLGLPIGGTVGVLIASQTAGRLQLGYLVFGAVVAGAALLLTGLCRDVPRREPLPSVPKRDRLAAFLSALANHDFRWAFIGRALMVLGYFSVVGYQLYILEDHIELPKGLAPTEAMAILTPVSMGAMAVSTVVGGLLSDRWNRRKVFVGLSAALAGIVTTIPVISPTWPGMLCFSALNGLAFGCFMAVDTAVVTLVLPRAEDAARDMGVLNIANAGPQIIAPFVASAVVTALGGYTPLFLIGGALSLLGALAILPIRGVR